MIPDNVITKPPTAELRENQKDQDSLPPYDMLDAILERLVEREEPVATIVAAGFDRDTVMRVDRMLNLAEYKRRQAAPGVKVTLRNFGRDRRYPITNRFRDPGTPLPKPRRSSQASRPKPKPSIFEAAAMSETHAAASPAANRRGMIALTLGMAAYTVNDTFVKLVARELPFGEVMFLRGVLSVVLTVALMIVVDLAALSHCGFNPDGAVARPV